jgi:hypothetical protein
MSQLRAGILVVVSALALAGLLAGDASTVGVQRGAGTASGAGFVEVKWPFPLDQWGRGRAFHCAAADCGVEVVLYLRAKIGFCNCETGVSDDDELDRVGDMELYSPKFVGLSGGRVIKVGWMSGRSRPYRVDVPYSPPRTAQAIAFNEQCDVIVATVVADLDRLAEADRLALEFLNGDMVLHWARKELGAA